MSPLFHLATCLCCVTWSHASPVAPDHMSPQEFEGVVQDLSYWERLYRLGLASPVLGDILVRLLT
jgi:hypothetical protein